MTTNALVNLLMNVIFEAESRQFLSAEGLPFEDRRGFDWHLKLFPPPSPPPSGLSHLKWLYVVWRLYFCMYLFGPSKKQWQRGKLIVWNGWHFATMEVWHLPKQINGSQCRCLFLVGITYNTHLLLLLLVALCPSLLCPRPLLSFIGW